MGELKKRKLGRTGLMVSELGFGAMNIPDVAEGEENAAIAQSYEPMTTDEISRFDEEADALLAKMAMR